MIREKCIGVEKIRPAERIEQILSLRGGTFDLMAAPAFHALDAPAHVIPIIDHPLLMFFEGIGLDKSLQRRLDGTRRNAGQDLRRSGSAMVEFYLASNRLGPTRDRQQRNKNGNGGKPRRN